MHGPAWMRGYRELAVIDSKLRSGILISPGSLRWRGVSAGGYSSGGPRWIFPGFFLRRRRPGGPSASLRMTEEEGSV